MTWPFSKTTPAAPIGHLEPGETLVIERDENGYFAHIPSMLIEQAKS